MGVVSLALFGCHDVSHVGGPECGIVAFLKCLYKIEGRGSACTEFAKLHEPGAEFIEQLLVGDLLHAFRYGLHVGKLAGEGFKLLGGIVIVGESHSLPRFVAAVAGFCIG